MTPGLWVLICFQLFFTFMFFPKGPPGGLSLQGLSGFGDKWDPCLDVASHTHSIRLPSTLDLAAQFPCEMHQEEQEAWPAKAGTGEPHFTPRTSRILGLPS